MKLTVTFTLLLVACGSFCHAQEEIANRDAKIGLAVDYLLRKHHMSPAPMPADFDEAVVDLYLRKLDPRKMYFRQADVEKFREQAKGLQRQLRRGDLSFMESVVKIYRQRVREVDEIAREFADHEFDFTIDETIDLDFRKKPYADSDAAARERWRKWTKYELLALRLPDETKLQKRERMKKRYTRFFNQVVTADRDEQLEDFLNAVGQAFDRHSGYLSPKTLDKFNI